MPRRRSRSEAALPTTVVLDAEALSVVATPGERGASRRRASAVLTALDAFVAATAADNRPATMLTGDPGDLRRLVGDLPNVEVRSLDAT